MFLAISKNSFHYRYYLLLRKMWSFKEERDEDEKAKMTSLCVYTQFLFWFTIMTVMTSPFILMGWFILKSGRLLYKVCSWTPPGRAFTDFLDAILGYGNWIDKKSEQMLEAPALSLCLTALTFWLAVVCITIVVAILLAIVFNVKLLLMYIAAVFMLLALAGFYVCFGVGWVLAHIWMITVMVVKAICWFLVAYASMIVMGLAIILLLGLVMFVMIKVATASEWLTQKLGFKLNGYQKAREENSKRRAERKKKAEEEYEKWLAAQKELKRKKEAGEVPYTFMEKLGKLFVRFFCWLGEFFVARTRNVKGGSVKAMSTIGVIFHTLKAMKQGVCPLVQFIDDEDDEPDGVEEAME